jgi:hypothetical protein
LLFSDHRNSLSFDNENKNAAGTAQDTVGHPGTNMPIKAKIVKIKPRD